MKKVITALILFLASVSPSYAQTNSIEVDFGNPPVGTLDPIFTVQNMLPGDVEQREVQVTNVSDSDIPVILYSQKTSENLPNWPNDPIGDEFSSILEITINDGVNDIYGGTSGAKSLQEFFNASAEGMNLGTLTAGNDITYYIRVEFPHSAGNDYQMASVVFDLMFEQYHLGGIVINEVYYDPDSTHGSDCSSDICGGEINAEIINNGAGSTNIIDIQINNSCLVVQSNNAYVINTAGVDNNTGDNSTNNSSFTSLITGSISSIINFYNNINVNYGSCDSIPDKNDEWIELYNGSTQSIALDGWMIEDNSGAKVLLETDEILEPGQFALISRSVSTWDYWEENADAVLIPIGTDCGNGLDNNGDHLILYNPNEVEVDFTAWGNDTYLWDPAVPDVDTGHSIERTLPGLDSDTINDWINRTSPSPGM